MKDRIVLCCVLVTVFFFLTGRIYPQTVPEVSDPPVNTNIPDFYRSKLSEIDAEIANVKKGTIEKIAVSPGGRPVYAVYYGKKDNLYSRANYNSAVAACNPAYYAKKTKRTKPVMLFVGPVHGQEIEGMVGMVNLIHIAETGRDLRGKEWPLLKQGIEQCRVVVLPCCNPDGRARCPFDSFVGLPDETMTKYGQGTNKGGTLWRWPQAKSLHPMKEDVGILGAYFNDNGINIMHDDFFFPMAEETKAILKIAKDEAPDMTVSLHSHTYPPCILQQGYLPFFMKERIAVLANHLNEHYKKTGLPFMSGGWCSKVLVDDKKFPPRESFNLISALHHISGTMAFTFECCHGTINNKNKVPIANHDTILDIQLIPYQEMFTYVLENRLYWE